MTPTPRDAMALIRSFRQIVLLTEGRSRPEFTKTAEQVLRYRPSHVSAVLDSTRAGETAEAVLGLGGSIPVIANLDAASGVDALFIGIAPPGGKMPEAWRATLQGALLRGVPVVSGLHDTLSNDAELTAAALQGGTFLIDVRRASSRRIASAPPRRPGCLRVLTVGTDCSVGKMSAAKELELELRRRGRDAAFVATGQTGMMIGGDGVTVDSVVSDFVNGAVEEAVLQQEHHEIVVIEGQGSIVHPSYSAVSVGLLHGAAPDALILCHEFGRTSLKSAPHVPVKPLAELAGLHEQLGGARTPCRVVGLALNGRRLTPDEGRERIDSIESELGLPACDVYRDGATKLADAIEEFDRVLRSQRKEPGRFVS